MTVFDLDRYVVREYERFGRSFTDIQTPDIKESVRQAYADSRFWPEPMIQLNPRFKGGGTVSELVHGGDLVSGMERLFRNSAFSSGKEDPSLRLHKHQLDAITLAKPAQKLRRHDRHRVRQIVVLLHADHRPGAAR